MLRSLVFLSLSTAIAASAFGQAKIVGGVRSASPYPWLAVQVYTGSDPVDGHFCGGALIAPNWVLTAGHCCDDISNPDEIYLLIGATDVRKDGRVAKVKSIHIHPDFDVDGRDFIFNDLALYELEEPITDIEPVRLVADGSLVQPGKMGRTVGFGTTRAGGTQTAILREVDVPVVPLEVADKTYKGLDFTNLAAGYPKGGADSCQGDSGGPLVFKDAQGWFLGGIVSFGIGCAEPGYYGIYSNVIILRDWISETIAGEEDPVYLDEHGDTLARASYLPVNLPADPKILPPKRQIKGLGRINNQYAQAQGGPVILVKEDIDMFKLNIASKGLLKIKSEGETDTKGALLNSKGNTVTSNDDSREGKGFELSAEVSPGTYYIKVQGNAPKGDEAISTFPSVYAIYSELAPLPPPAPDIAVYFGANEVSSLAFGATPIGSTQRKTLSIGNKGKATLEISKASVTGPFSLVAQPASKISPGRSASLSVQFKPETTRPIVFPGYSLRLTSGNNEQDQPQSGNGLVVISKEAEVLHFVVFDRGGHKIVDLTELQIIGHDVELKTLRTQLDGQWNQPNIPSDLARSIMTSVGIISGRAYVGELLIENNDPDESEKKYSISLSGESVLPPTDDYGNALENAKSVNAPSSTPGVLTFADQDVFRFSLNSTSSVVIQSRGFADTKGVLKSITGELIAENDDSTAAEKNFQISKTLNKGTYCVIVSAKGLGAGDGVAYQLTIDSRATRR